MLLERLGSSPRHQNTNLLSVLHDHVDLIHSVGPDCHIDHVDDIVMLQRS